MGEPINEQNAAHLGRFHRKCRADLTDNASDYTVQSSTLVYSSIW